MVCHQDGLGSQDSSIHLIQSIRSFLWPTITNKPIASRLIGCSIRYDPSAHNSTKRLELLKQIGAGNSLIQIFDIEVTIVDKLMLLL